MRLSLVQQSPAVRAAAFMRAAAYLPQACFLFLVVFDDGSSRKRLRAQLFCPSAFKGARFQLASEGESPAKGGHPLDSASAGKRWFQRPFTDNGY